MKNLARLFLLGLISLSPLVSLTSEVRGQKLSNRDLSNSIDLARLTCRELLKSEGSDRSNLIIFMHGYMSGKKSDLRIDVPELSEVTDRVIDNCIDKPETELLRIFERYR